MQSGGSRGGGKRTALRGYGLLGCLALSGCMRLGYDLLSGAADGSGAFDGLTSTASEPSSISGRLDAGGHAAPEELRTFDPGLVWDPVGDRREARGGPLRDWDDPAPRDLSPNPPPPDAGLDGGAGGAPPVTAQACQLSGNELMVNGFDGPTGGVQARGAGNPTLSWSASEGNPDPGSLEFQSSGGAGEIYYPGSLGDLRGRVMSLNVQVALGTAVRFRLFVESGALRRRARAPFSDALLGQWDCSQVVVDAPASAESGFDPTNIVGAGLEIEAAGNVRVYVDQIAY